MDDLSTKTCWALTEGHAGMQNQCVGLAEALGVTCTVKRIQPRAPWKFLPAPLWPAPLSMAAPDTKLTAPWPDILITCGRRSVAASLRIKKLSGGKTFTIHIQDPHVPAARFDMLVVPEHDSLRAENVIVVRGAMHHVTPEKLDAARAQFAPQFAHLPRPLIGVLVGGSNRRQELTGALVADLADKLIAAGRMSGGGIALTPSRRTGAANEAILRDKLQNTPSYIWDGSGPNPYIGLLACADIIVATSDSVSMVTEACVTGKPVYVYDVPGASARLQSFQNRLIDDGITRIFTGRIEQWPGRTLNETARAAGIIRQRLAKDRQ